MIPKNVKRMIKLMEDAGYTYCEYHDVYFDDGLSCPSCALRDIIFDITKIYLFSKNHYKELIEKFDPNSRDYDI